MREVERRIQKAEADVSDNPLPDLDRPLGVPASYAEHARLMFDLQLLAMQGDITRVITFQLARETSNRSYPELGVPESHHPLSHHGNDEAKIAKMAKINQFHVSLFAGFLEKLRDTRDGNGTLRFSVPAHSPENSYVSAEQAGYLVITLRVGGAPHHDGAPHGAPMGGCGTPHMRCTP